MTDQPSILSALQHYWGYDSFRPMQERIVSSLLAGHDACVVMPTGGGKSLCYQLPAAMLSKKTVVVISPLIALMQDQMAQLSQMGISAGTLNSSLASDEQSRIQRQASAGALRLLYLSPERLARRDTVEWLKRVPIALFAIDEAHCISEWGHEFRPEYRQLSALREHFAEQPIAAFTASATRQVRHDIIHQLRLRNPDKYIASFHRPNLRYVVKECESGTQEDLLTDALRRYTEGNVIVYAPTIHKVEETVDFLEELGIAALAYHGKMENDTRRRNQERWTSDEVRVLVGTIAFGLGINKASVRAVIHLSLPKSIEQYYQEAGRAGRDGQPADCLLLWQRRDVGLLTYFIENIGDPEEKQRAWQRYHQVRRFVEANECRHLQVCSHFGETPKWKTCGACDVCGTNSEWLTMFQAHRPHRMRKKKKVAIQSESPISLSREARPELSEVDRQLSHYLREWRRGKSRQQGIAAFVVMHDTTLEALCRARPATRGELRRVPGFGERKVELYGQEIFELFRQFDAGARATEIFEKRSKPAEETLRLLAQGRTLEQIAETRGRQLSSVVSMVAEMVERGEVEFQTEWIEPDTAGQIEALCSKMGTERLRPIKDQLPQAVSFDQVRLVVAKLRRRQAQVGTAD